MVPLDAFGKVAASSGWEMTKMANGGKLIEK